MSLYDYIYVDLDKVVSLYSQLTGGVVEVIEKYRDQNSVRENKRNYDFKVFKHDAADNLEKNRGERETLKPHHSFLQELEEKLESDGYLIDISKDKKALSLKNDRVRETLKNALCIKCTGRVVIEDYERIKNISIAFPDIVELISASTKAAFKETPEYQEALGYIQAIQSTSSDRNNQAKNKSLIKEKERELERMLNDAVLVQNVEPWVLEGMRTWIDSFMSGITNIRVYPSIKNPDEHIYGHLELNNFLIQSSNSFHFTYGSFPTEEMTMIGIITSVPNMGGESFDPLTEMNKNNLADDESIERAFRGIFRGFDGLEAMIRTNRYPRILVYPILVYREAKATQKNLSLGD
jgi:hypothetical protein